MPGWLLENKAYLSSDDNDTTGTDKRSIWKVEDDALRDLGGLHSAIPDGNGVKEADIICFSTTKRLTESLCLFYYTFQITHFPSKQPTAKSHSCLPILWWNGEERAIARGMSVRDETIWRVGNVILDVGLEKMSINCILSFQIRSHITRYQWKFSIDVNEVIE